MFLQIQECRESETRTIQWDPLVQHPRCHLLQGYRRSMNTSLAYDEVHILHNVSLEFKLFLMLRLIWSVSDPVFNSFVDLQRLLGVEVR